MSHKLVIPAVVLVFKMSCIFVKQGDYSDVLEVFFKE